MDTETKHLWLTALACALPLIAIFFLPLLGLKGRSISIAVITILSLHVIMLASHGESRSLSRKMQSKRGLKG